MFGNRTTGKLAVTVSATALVGILVLNSGAIAARFTETPAASSMLIAETVPQNSIDVIIPKTPKIAPLVLASLSPPVDFPEQASLKSDALTEPNLSAFGLDCDLMLNATPTLAGMVQLSVHAPCKPEQFFSVQQGDMVFTDMTSPLGLFDAMVPALTEEVSFEVTFEDGEQLFAQATVPAAHQFDHVVLQWRGDAGLQIHALEFGADYGDQGHVSADRPRTPSVAVKAAGGFLSELGARDLMFTKRAEVYSFPTGLMGRSGLVRLSVEAEVTLANCEKLVDATTLQVSHGIVAPKVDISLSMPDCSAVGDFLVLKNLLRDLKIAQN
ncbi:MAG: hypothetical protein ABJO27_16425 [Pseudoruegeria sp.]